MKETIEHNNRFYGEELKTENEQLKEWLVIANESNDYFREENVRLINREKELLGEIHNKINEIERLNNIIKKLERLVDDYAWNGYYIKCGNRYLKSEILNDIREIIELKGSDKE